VPLLGGNPSNTLTGPLVPGITFHNTDFWAQGINLGLSIIY
jgi:hypothetical protein